MGNTIFVFVFSNSGHLWAGLQTTETPLVLFTRLTADNYGQGRNLLRSVGPVYPIINLY